MKFRRIDLFNDKVTLFAVFYLFSFKISFLNMNPNLFAEARSKLKAPSSNPTAKDVQVKGYLYFIQNLPNPSPLEPAPAFRTNSISLKPLPLKKM